MIKLDRVKILTRDKYVYDLHPEKLKTFSNTTINQKKPYNLFIELQPYKETAIIEFSAKILLDKYHELITMNTIRQCFQNICDEGYCKLDIDNIINECVLLTCDYTIDIDGIDLPEKFKTILIGNLRNVSKFHIQDYNKSGYTITKMVKTKSRQIRLSIYDKYKEMQKASNKGFINSLTHPDQLMNYFKGKIRFETNIKTQKQIRDYFGITDTLLVSVLNSKENPLLKIFNTVFLDHLEENEISINDNSSILDLKAFNQLKDVLVLKACNNDLSMVKEVLNTYFATGTNKGKYMTAYRKLFNGLSQQSENKFIIGQIRDKLSVA